MSETCHAKVFLYPQYLQKSRGLLWADFKSCSADNTGHGFFAHHHWRWIDRKRHALTDEALQRLIKICELRRHPTAFYSHSALQAKLIDLERFLNNVPEVLRPFGDPAIKVWLPRLNLRVQNWPPSFVVIHHALDLAKRRSVQGIHYVAGLTSFQTGKDRGALKCVRTSVVPDTVQFRRCAAGLPGGKTVSLQFLLPHPSEALKSMATFHTMLWIAYLRKLHHSWPVAMWLSAQSRLLRRLAQPPGVLRSTTTTSAYPPGERMTPIE